jgi:hypothetical protein
MNRTIILTLSLAAALLAATASTASAGWGLYVPENVGPSVTSFDFGDRHIGTSSPAQDFVLWVGLNTTINPRISVSGDYAQRNDCPPTLMQTTPQSAAGCTISVTFTPTSAGPKEGTLSTGPRGPAATLTGNGVTTPTPPALPLTLFVRACSVDAQCYPEDRKAPILLEKKLELLATTNNDSTLVVGGGVKRTTKQVAGGIETQFKVKLKHPKRLNEEAGGANPSEKHPEVKIKVAATDEFGQTATDVVKLRFRRNPSL